MFHREICDVPSSILRSWDNGRLTGHVDLLLTADESQQNRSRRRIAQVQGRQWLSEEQNDCLSHLRNKQPRGSRVSVKGSRLK